MLQVNFLRENKERVTAGLNKRNFKQIELVDEAISTDDERKKLQFELDQNLTEMNKISKEIGILMKEGKKEEAGAAREKVGTLKESSRQLDETLKDTDAPRHSCIVPNAFMSRISHSSSYILAGLFSFYPMVGYIFLI